MAILSGVIRAMLRNELQLLQNKAAKIILSLPSFYSSTEALEELCWPTLFKLRLFHRCVFVYKYVNGIIDFKFDTKLISDIHSYTNIILVANPIFTYRELGAIMENSAFYIKDWENGTVLTSQYVT